MLQPHEQAVAERIDSLMTIPQVGALVNEYFAADITPELSTTFAGSLFDTLGHNPSNELTHDDLLALNLLDTPITAAAIRYLDGNPTINALLDRLPTDAALWDVDSDSDTDRDARELWTVINQTPGFGPTRTAKLCARKRPHLIPIYDTVIQGVLGFPENGMWDTLRAVLKDRHELIRDLDPLIPGYDPSVLRLLDVAAWMIGSNSQAVQNARVRVGLSREPLKL